MIAFDDRRTFSQSHQKVLVRPANFEKCRSSMKNSAKNTRSSINRFMMRETAILFLFRIHTFINLFIRLFIHLFIYLFASFIYSLVYLCINWNFFTTLIYYNFFELYL